MFSVVYTIAAFIFVLGIVVFFHELGHFIAAKLSGVRVHRFSLGFPPKMIGFRRGETEYCISWIPLGGYVKMAGENPQEAEELGNDPGNLMNKPAWKKALIFFAGPFANYLTAVIIATGLFLYLGREVVDPEKVVIGQVEAESPAEKVGMRAGDIIRSVNGIQIIKLEDLHAQVVDSPNTVFNMTWEREGQLFSAPVVTQLDSALSLKGVMVKYGKIGIRQASDTIAVNPFEAFKLANQAAWRVTVLMGSILKQLISGEASLKILGGPIAIAKISGERAREGLPSLVDFIVLISINLALLNLLPIPILDGGHLLMLLIESLRRRPLTLKQKAIYNQVGLAILTALLILVFYNDIFGRLIK